MTQTSELVKFVKQEIHEGTPTDNIIKKIVILNKLELLQKLYDQKKLVATDSLWENVDNKSRLHRLFKRYEKFYYPRHSFLNKLRLAFTFLPAQQSQKDTLFHVLKRVEVLENRCIRLIENIYSDVKTNKINLPGGVKYYRDTKAIHMPFSSAVLRQHKLPRYATFFDVLKNISSDNMPKYSLSFTENLEDQYKDLYEKLKLLQLRKFAQKDLEKTMKRFFKK